MRIAFVGKGGAGKTTLATFFVKYLLKQEKSVLALDADINIHFAKNFGLVLSREGALSTVERKKAIREYLRGTNSRIESVNAFVKTTPPGEGSSLIRIVDTDVFIRTWTTVVRPTLFVAFVGTYEADEIGTSCYHTNLTIAENIVSHVADTDTGWLVTDMVAGTDAFSGSLHLLFDAIFLVVEPTPEGVAVFHQYKKLAEAAGVWEHVWVIGNKVQDEADRIYLQDRIGDRMIATIREQKTIRQAKQREQQLSLEEFGQEDQWGLLVQKAQDHRWNRQLQLQALYSLHLRHANESYVRNSIGDVTGQIDPEYLFSE